MTAAATNDNAPNVIAPKLFRRELPCKLNESEIMKYAAMLSSKVRERDMLDDQRKSVAAEYSSKIKSVTTEISRVAVALDKGEELRSIDCYQEFRNGVMHTIRTDNGATVEVRPATLADRQTELPGPNGTTVAPTGTDFPDLDEGPSGEEMLPETAGGGGLVTSSVGDAVYHQPDDPEGKIPQCPSLHGGKQCELGEGHTAMHQDADGTAWGGDDLTDALDEAFEQRQEAKAENQAAAATADKPAKKRGGNRKKAM